MKCSPIIVALHFLAGFACLCLGVSCSDSKLDAEAESADADTENSAETSALKVPAAVEESQAEPEKPQPIFDLSREGDTIVLSGRIRSQIQADDMAAALRMDGLSLDNKLEVDPETTGIDWGNRVADLLPRLVMAVPDLKFHVEDGVITVTGTVASDSEKDSLQRDIVYVMESPSISDLKNELKVKEGSGGGQKSKGKGKGEGKDKGGEPEMREAAGEAQ